jgi:hypothetical protein
MQEAALDFFAQFNKPPTKDEDKDGNDEPDFGETDFGWMLGWEIAKEIGTLFVHYRILPEAGGWWNQRADVRHDLLQFLEGVAWGSQDGSQEETMPGIENTNKAKDWLELM